MFQNSETHLYANANVNVFSEVKPSREPVLCGEYGLVWTFVNAYAEAFVCSFLYVFGPSVWQV